MADEVSFLSSMKLYLHNIFRRSDLGITPTPRQAYDLIISFIPWHRSLSAPSSPDPFVHETPWFTLPAIRFLEARMEADWIVFEWGSGASTLFFLNHVDRVVAVEHVRDWFEVLQRSTTDRGSDRLELRLVLPDEETGRSLGDPRDPTSYSSHAPSVQSRTFTAYAAAIDDYPNESFDLVCIDGRARPSCFVHALPHVKSGGYLLLDDSSRPHYDRAIAQAPATWRRYDFPGPIRGERYFGKTTILQRP